MSLGKDRLLDEMGVLVQQHRRAERHLGPEVEDDDAAEDEQRIADPRARPCCRPSAACRLVVKAKV
jgi:hypothetical protein